MRNIKSVAAKAAVFALTVSGYVNMLTVKAFAAPSAKDIFSGASTDGGTMSGLVTGVKTAGRDVYTLLMWIGGFGCVLAFIVAALTFGMSRQSNKKEEAKGWMVAVIIAAIIIFAAIFIIGIAQKFGTSISSF